MIDAHIIVKGFVQGIGYRKWARKEAQRVEVTGWVRNLPDGSVEALLRGDKDILELLIEKYKKGPFMSEVKSIDVVWEDSPSHPSADGGGETLPDFSIRHDF